MAQGETAVVRQRRLRAELRRLRVAAGYTQESVAAEVGWSHSKVIRIETGVSSISTSDLMAILHVYGVAGSILAKELVAITREKPKSWWDEYRSTFPPPFLKLIAYEDSAVRIGQFASLSVPELLQTQKYTRAVLNKSITDKQSFKHSIRILMRRKKLLARNPGPQLAFVLDEAVIHRSVGDPGVMRDQLIQIKELAEHPHVSIRIVPFSEGLQHGMNMPFAILELPVEEGDFVVSIENPNGYVVIDNDPEASSKYVELFRELQQAACPEEQVHEIIDSVIGKLER